MVAQGSDARGDDPTQAPAGTLCLFGHDRVFPPAVLEHLRAELPQHAVRRLSYELAPGQRQRRTAERLSEAEWAEEPAPSPEVVEALAGCVAILGLDVPGGLERLAPRLLLVQGYGAGVEWFRALRLHEHGIALCNSRQLASPSIAEFVMARLLQVWKQLPVIDAQQAERRWEPRWGPNLAGRTVGLAGFGGIGRAVAVRARAFGMRVVATRQRIDGESPMTDDPDADLVFPASQLDRMVAECDAVVCSVPDIPSANDLFDAGRFAAMRPGAVFVNVSRGALVDEDALLDALRRGHLGAAVLDVAKQEPAPPDRPFWTTERLLFSPHCSMSFDGYGQQVVDLFIDNVRRLGDGRPLRNLVDPVLGY